MSNEFGINVVGTFKAETGFGDAVRGTVSALAAAGIPVNIIDLGISLKNRLNDESISCFTEENTYPANLVQVNPFLMPALLKNKGTGFFKDKYNIAYWVWEASEVSDEFMEYAFLFDEIWTSSEYCMNVIAQKSSIPVICIPHIAQTENATILPPPPVAIPGDKFVFLNIFDFGSLIERKNTLGLIEAFEKAFGTENDRVMLFLKSATGFNYPDDKKKIESRISPFSNITLTDAMFSRNELLAIMQRADCYVSLHRSEGFGLNIADAMAMGKPVIATGYSGNMQFMTINNSLPVKYTLKEIPHTIGPYPAGSKWSEPDTGHAAMLMQYVITSPDDTAILAEKAKNDMATGFSAEAISNLIKKRAAVIKAKLNTGNSGTDLQKELDSAAVTISLLEDKVKYLENTLYNKIRRKINRK